MLKGKMSQLKEILAREEIGEYNETNIVFKDGSKWDFRMNSLIKKEEILLKRINDENSIYDYICVLNNHNYCLKEKWFWNITESIDWDKVKKGTKVLLKTFTKYNRMYFSEYIGNNNALCFEDGADEWSASGTAFCKCEDLLLYENQKEE